MNNLQQNLSEQLDAYAAHLRTAEYASGTINKYLRDVRAFDGWLAERNFLPLYKSVNAICIAL